MSYLETETMVKFLLPYSAVAFAFLAFDAAAQAKFDLSAKDDALTGLQLTPRAELDVYAGKPSSVVGNLFNRERGAIDPGDSYVVVASEAYPGLGGSDIWIEIEPTDKSNSANAFCQDGGCWVYLGTTEAVYDDRRIEQNILGNFEIEATQGELASK